MKYDRLTRFVKVEIDGAEYKLRLTLGMFEDLEDLLPKGKTFINMMMNQETPGIKMLKKAFCLALRQDDRVISSTTAEKYFEKYCEENGIQGAVALFYALVAASQLLGATTSNEMLKSMGLIVKDEEPEPAGEEKNE